MRFEQSIDIAAPAHRLFEATQDYAHRLEWDPFLRSAELVGDATTPEVGARAWCVANSGIGMETEYVSYSPPHRAAVKMTRGPFFLENFAGSWRFEPLSQDETQVIFCYSLNTRPKILRRLLNPLATWIFARDTRKRLSALKSFVERSQPDPDCFGEVDHK